MHAFSYQNKIKHYHIKFKDNMYTIDDEEKFDNLTQLVEHYQKDADSPVTRLHVPVAKEGKQNYFVEMDDFKKCECMIAIHASFQLSYMFLVDRKWMVYC